MVAISSHLFHSARRFIILSNGQRRDCISYIYFLSVISLARVEVRRWWHGSSELSAFGHVFYLGRDDEALIGLGGYSGARVRAG